MVPEIYQNKKKKKKTKVSLSSPRKSTDPLGLYRAHVIIYNGIQKWFIHLFLNKFSNHPSVTGGEKISGSTRIRTQGLRNTVPALYHWATEPHVDLLHDIRITKYLYPTT